MYGVYTVIKSILLLFCTTNINYLKQAQNITVQNTVQQVALLD